MHACTQSKQYKDNINVVSHQLYCLDMVNLNFNQAHVLNWLEQGQQKNGKIVDCLKNTCLHPRGQKNDL